MYKVIGVSCSVLPLLVSAGMVEAKAVLEEIVVTAQKRAESLQDVPISVAAITGEAITNNGINRLDDIDEFVPNLMISDNFVGSEIRIRGIGTSPGNSGFEQAVATFIDGVYFGRDRSSLAAFLDIERVEVLRGPQPTFFGQNAIAGALNISTHKPGQEPEGYINATYGTDDEYSVDFAYGGPLTDTLGVRLALRTNGMDGFIENLNSGDVPERDSKSGRLIADYKPTNDLSVTLKYEASELEQSGHTLQPVTCSAETDGNPSTSDPIVPCHYALTNVTGYEAGLNDKLATGGYLPPPSGPVLFLNGAGIPVVDASQVDFFQHEDRNLDTSNAAITLEYDFGDVVLNAISAYVEYDSEEYLDVDATPFALIHPHIVQDFEQTSQEIRLTSASESNHDWMVGIYYQNHELYELNELPTAYLSPFGSITIGQNHTEESEWLSTFFAGTWHITDSVHLQYGLRYTEVEKDGSIRAISTNLTCNGGPCAPGQIATEKTPTTVIAASGYNETFKDNDLNPTVGIQWDINNDVMVYAKYAEAFKSGGFNTGNKLPKTADAYVYESEQAETFEIGAKMNLLENRLELNISLWSTEYSSLQTNAFVQDSGSFNVENAGAATSEGIEFDGRFAASDNLTLRFSGSVMEAKFDKYDGAQCNDAERLSGACSGNGSISREGFELKGSPEWSASLGGDYNIPMANGYQVTISGDVFVSDGYVTTEIYTPGSEQDAYEMVNTRIALSPDNGSWEGALYARNITDERIAAHTGPGALSGFNTYDQVISRGASYGVMFKYQF